MNSREYRVGNLVGGPNVACVFMSRESMPYIVKFANRSNYSFFQKEENTLEGLARASQAEIYVQTKPACRLSKFPEKQKVT